MQHFWELIFDSVHKYWIAYFGTPRQFLTDNGGEFSNELFREVNEKLGIETRTTAGEAPYSNGIVERHHKMLYECMVKTIEDVKCEPEVALSWALCAKNSLQNHGGYSPNHLVFGHNINMPCVLNDEPPALTSTTSSDIIRKNMNALHLARKNYIEAESSERIRRALKHQVRSYADCSYENGDKAFYRRKDNKLWIVPAVVFCQDG